MAEPSTAQLLNVTTVNPSMEERIDKAVETIIVKYGIDRSIAAHIKTAYISGFSDGVDEASLVYRR